MDIRNEVDNFIPEETARPSERVTSQTRNTSHKVATTLSKKEEEEDIK